MKSYADRGDYLPKPKACARWITPSEICISSYHTKAEFNNCLIIHSKYYIYIKVTVHHLLEKCQNYAFCLCCGRKACPFFLCVCLKLTWFILERSHVFSLRTVENDLSPAALVAGFTRISLHNVITSTMMSSKQK